MRISAAILTKQCKDSLHNFPSLLLMMIYPSVAWIMITAMGSEENMRGFLIPMFAAMHGSFAPLAFSSNILSEEKEKGTLRSLIMAGVSSIQYLISISFFVVLTTMLMGSTFLFMGEFTHGQAFSFAAAMLAGAVLSTLIGLCVGIYAKNVTAANGIAVPVGLVFALLPMLGRFNSSIDRAAKLTYSGQISSLMQGGSVTAQMIAVFGVYFTALGILLAVLFKYHKI